MNQKVIIAIAGAAIAAGAAWLVMEQSSTNESTSVESFTLPRIEGVRMITVRCADTEIVVERDGNAWHVSAPFSSDADEAFVSRIAEVFSDVRGVDRTRSAEEQMQQLDEEGAIHVDVVGQSGEFHGTIAAAIGGGSAIRELSWVVPDESSTAFRVGTDLFARLDCDAEAYRDSIVVPWNADDVTQVRLRVRPLLAADFATLERGEQGWTMTAPEGVDTLLDNTRVDQFVGMLTRLSASRLASGLSLEDAGISEASPWVALSNGREEIKLTLGRAVPDPSLEGAPPGDPRRQYYVRVNDEEQVWELPSAASERLVETVVELRSLSVSMVTNDLVEWVSVDHHAGDTVERVFRLSAPTCAVGEECPIEAWSMDTDDGPIALDPTVTSAFLNSAFRLRAAQWLPAAPAAFAESFERSGVVIRLGLRDGEERAFEFVEIERQPGQRPARLGKNGAGDVFVMSTQEWELLMRPPEVFRRD
jgi:hypothetical protein